MTAPRNPSELQRLEEDLEHYKKQFKHCPTKAGKEMMLKYIRQIEDILGLEHQDYNTTKGI